MQHENVVCFYAIAREIHLISNIVFISIIKPFKFFGFFSINKYLILHNYAICV